MALTEDGKVVTDDISEEGRIVLDSVLVEDGRILDNGEVTKTKTSSIGLTIKGTNTKTSTIGLRISEIQTKDSSIGLRIVTQQTKESSIGLTIYAPPSPYEDFTTFTEVDIGADRIQKSANHIDHYACKNETTYVYKDYGVAHFSDFTHKIKARAVSGTNGSYGVCWMLANDLGNVRGLDTSGKSFVYLTFYHYWTGFWNNKLQLTEIYNGTLYEDTYTLASTTAWHYVKIVKSCTALTAYIYSDSDYTVLLDTLVLTMHVNGSYKYLYGCNTYNYSTSGTCLTTDIENFELLGGKTEETKESSIGLSIQETFTKESSIGLSVQETKTKTSSVGLSISETKTKTSSVGLFVLGANTKESTIGLSVRTECGNVSILGLTIAERKTKTSSVGLYICGRNSKTSSVGLSVQEVKTKTSTIGISIRNVFIKTSSIGLRIPVQIPKESSIGITVQTTPTKESSIGLSVVTFATKLSSISIYVSGSNTKVSSLGLRITEPVLKKGLFYGKLGNTIFEGLTPEKFRITKETNKIPTFEFEIANTSTNRTAIAAGIDSAFKIYWLHHGDTKHMFTGIINADGIEYISFDRIQITGYASYVKLAWPFHKHLASEDKEPVNVVFDYHNTYTDRTVAANNNNINDVILDFSAPNYGMYIGENNPFWGAQIKYTTKGISPPGCKIEIEYSCGGGIWKHLDVLDESNGFTEDPGTYDLIISHPPSDWTRSTVSAKKKYWLRFRIVSGSYTTQPKLDRIYIVNIDVYRTYYFDTSAREILETVLANTEYAMDAIDQCPEDNISILAEYESPLRIVAGIANALTWTDANGDKKAYQWWIDDNKKVHIKTKRGTTYNDDITGDMTIFNNHEDYFHLSNRLIGFGPRDGLSQIRAIVQDRVSIAAHGLREIAVPKEQVGKYLMLRNSLEKDIAISKNPMQRIKGSVTTEFWELCEYDIGDTITLHQTAWNVPETAMQIVKVEIGPQRTTLNLGISQEHLDGLKDNLQRQLNLNNVRMHGSTTVLEAGPETMNYQRVSESEVYPAKLEIEIPSDVIKVHKVLLSWSIVPYRADVGPTSGAGDAHDHDGWGGAGGAILEGNVGAGGAFTPDVWDDGGFTPAMWGKAHVHQTESTITLVPLTSYFWKITDTNIHNTNHRHSGGGTGYPDDTAWALVPNIVYGSSCGQGACIKDIPIGKFAEDTHYHQNSNTGYTSSGGTISGVLTEFVQAMLPYYFSANSNEEEPAHIHDGVEEPDHGHAGIEEAAHSDHAVPAEAAHSDHAIVEEAGGSVSIIYDIYEEAAGTTLELLVNNEKVGEYSTPQTEIRIDGFMNSGNNTVALQPIVGENKKGGADIKASGILFVEPRRF